MDADLVLLVGFRDGQGYDGETKEWVKANLPPDVVERAISEGYLWEIDVNGGKKQVELDPFAEAIGIQYWKDYGPCDLDHETLKQALNEAENDLEVVREAIREKLPDEMKDKADDINIMLNLQMPY